MTLNSRVARQFWRITTPFLTEQGRLVVGLVALMALCTGLLTYLNVANSFMERGFMTALGERNRDNFTYYASWRVAGLVACTVIAVFYRFIEERLGLAWRGWLTAKLIGLLEKGKHRLKGNLRIDNPEERITEGVKILTGASLSLFLIVVNSACALIAFSGVLWSITPWLFAAAIGYAICGSGLTMWFGRSLVRLNHMQLELEGSLRYELITQRESASRNGEAEKDAVKARDRLASVVQNLRRMIAANRNLSFFTTGYDYFIPLLPVLVAAPLFFTGQVELGVITQSAIAFGHVMGASSLIVKQFVPISACSAVVIRVGDLMDVLESDEVVISESPAPPDVSHPWFECDSQEEWLKSIRVPRDNGLPSVTRDWLS